MSDWEIFKGTPREPHDEVARLMKEGPPWRDFKSGPSYRGLTYLASPEEKRLVNAAIHLRRPVLVTGPPGCGKSSLAYAIAEELRLGPVLKWPINSRSTLAEGLYHYDAIARLRDANLPAAASPAGDARPADGTEVSGSGGGDPAGTAVAHPGAERRDGLIESYLHLQWLGTALASPTPRVLLIDEIDKADIDLPNDLLHVLEEGSFVIPELRRVAGDRPDITLGTVEADGRGMSVSRGVVPCKAFPIILITSNNERELPLAFHRRCLRLDIKPPDEDRLVEIVKSHLGRILASDEKTEGSLRRLAHEFADLRQSGRVMASDQLLNLAYLVLRTDDAPGEAEGKALQELIFRGLDQ